MSYNRKQEDRKRKGYDPKVNRKPKSKKGKKVSCAVFFNYGS